MQSTDKGAAFVALLLAGIAGVMLWQSRAFTSFAAIFPRAVGAALLVSSLLVLLRILRRRAPPTTRLETEGLIRSGGLVLTMLGWIALLETAGFLLASWVGFFILALLANHEPLHAKRLSGFAIGALVGVVALQLLFQRGLDVNLPAGIWLPGLIK